MAVIETGAYLGNWHAKGEQDSTEDQGDQGDQGEGGGKTGEAGQ